LLSESLDRKLTFWQRVNLRVHLVICGFCRNFAQDLHRFHVAVRTYSQHIEAGSGPADARLGNEARERILKVMEKEKM